MTHVAFVPVTASFGLGIVSLGQVGTGIAQTPLANLNFESPILPLIENGLGQVSITMSLPGWTGFHGTTEVDWTAYNTVSLGAAGIEWFVARLQSEEIYAPKLSRFPEPLAKELTLPFFRC